MDSVTVILPTFNRAETIERALNSILCQDYSLIEIIVIDDGSTDETVGILKQYGSKITVIEQKNSGPSAARNRGLKLASGRFVAFLDSDDYWLPGFLSKCASALYSSRDVVAVNTMTKAIHWSGREVIVPSAIRHSSSLIQIDNFFEFWAAHDHIRTGSVMFDREVAGFMPLFREELFVSEDLEYWAFLATLGKWSFLPEVLFVNDGRSHSTEISWKQRNHERRQRVPTIASWEKRLVSNVAIQEVTAYRKMRGRVARIFTHMSILNSEDVTAREIVLTHGKDFPVGRLNRVMLTAALCGKICWGILTRVLRTREAAKEVYLAMRTKRAAVLESKVTH